MIDIHSHILAGLDDGAKTLADSVLMVKMAAASGTTDIVATPHANPQYAFNPELVEQKIADLQRATGNLLNIHLGCDFHLSATNVQDALACPTKYAINHRCYVLVEFSDFAIPPSAAEIFRKMQTAGMLPIITHPERNALLQRNLKQIKVWVDQECLVQVTAQSFLGRFGKRAKNFADELMSNGLVHFVASDAHDAVDRTPVLSEAYRYVATAYGSDLAEQVFVTNPRAALLGGALEPFEAELSRTRKWHDFFGKCFGGSASLSSK